MDLLTAFRTHLVAVSLARLPNSATPAAHPLWVEPLNGTPAPGEKSGVNNDVDRTLGAYQTNGPPSKQFESGYRSDIIDLEFRTKRPEILPGTFALEKLIRAAIIDKRNWDLADLRILQSYEWRAMQRVNSDEATGYVHSAAYLFYHYA